MRRLLFVRASIFGEAGQSSQLADAFLQRFVQQNPAATVVVRDVLSPPLPHLDAATFAAFGKPTEALTPADQALLRLSDTLIAELETSTDLLIGLPMYNFGLPSAFKAWIDHISRGRRTFRYTAKGPEGLLRNIGQSWVIAARGGQYHGTPLDTQTPYLATMLGFLGIAAPTFIYAEGMARPDARDNSLAAARHTIEELALR